MDLIYANQDHEDVGVISEYGFDLAYGVDENDFELAVSLADSCCEKNYLIYMEGTEYGGVVDDISVNTSSGVVTYHGRTWHGIIDGKVLTPDAGQEYYSVEGDANIVLAQVINRIGLSELFNVEQVESGISVNYKFNRYCKAYSGGLLKMFAQYSLKLDVKWLDGKVCLAAKKANDYTKMDDFDSDQINFKVKNVFNKPNHLICLGKGELAERTVVNLYCNENGEIGNTQSIFGADEITEIYENTSAENQELIERGMEKFNELLSCDTVDTSLESDFIYEIGDIVGAKEQVTGISVVTRINKKIIKINDGIISTDYETGGF